MEEQGEVSVYGVDVEGHGLNPYLLDDLYIQLHTAAFAKECEMTRFVMVHNIVSAGVEVEGVEVGEDSLPLHELMGQDNSRLAMRLKSEWEVSPGEANLPTGLLVERLHLAQERLALMSFADDISSQEYLLIMQASTVLAYMAAATEHTGARNDMPFPLTFGEMIPMVMDTLCVPSGNGFIDPSVIYPPQDYAEELMSSAGVALATFTDVSNEQKNASRV